MNVKFYYQDTLRKRQHEATISVLTNLISKIISLPDTIEVCLYPLEGIYAGVDCVHSNRIGIDYNTQDKSLPLLLTHELIHVHQMHVGFLKMKPDGSCYWRNVYYTNKKPEEMTHEEYMKLPWEMDAYNNQNSVLRQALQLLDK